MHLLVVSLLSAVILTGSYVLALDNGLGITPPMGWLTWERFRCNINCTKDPENCISEKLLMAMADRMASDGYKDVGYEYVIVDDCWLAKERDAQGRLQPDPERFPRGIKNLSDYIHSKGLKFGIYEDYGTHTCAGYPGSIDHLELDANTFAEWGVDYLKLDGCNVDPAKMDQGYREMGKFLNKTGRPIFYSCEWPFYQQVNAHITPNYTAIAEVCNLWRNYNDIQDSLPSLLDIVDYHTQNQDEFAAFAGPGGWNDPDMLIVGDFGLSFEQSKAQMALWAVTASPLIMSNDLRSIKDDYKAILQNKKIIAVNQDSLGIQGKRVHKNRLNNIEIWTKPINPIKNNALSYAIVAFNRRDDGMPFRFEITFKQLGLYNTFGYHVTDLYDNVDHGVVYPNDKFELNVNPTGVVMLKAEAASKKKLPVVLQLKK